MSHHPPGTGGDPGTATVAALAAAARGAQSRQATLHRRGVEGASTTTTVSSTPGACCRIHSKAGAEIWEPQPHISPQFSIYMEQSVRRQLKSHERPELPGGCRVAIMAPLSRESVEWPKECRAAMNGHGQPFQSHIVALIRIFPATIGVTC